jgi:hypothetical protein
MTMPSMNLGMPGYVNDLWAEHGFTEAVRRVTVQQHGSDSKSAFDYYSAILAAMSAINGETIPAVPAFGGAATKLYAYAQVPLLALRARGSVSDAAYGRTSALRLVAHGVVT